MWFNSYVTYVITNRKVSAFLLRNENQSKLLSTFLTINYPKNSGYGGSGEQAYERFSQVMIPLMLKRGSHPIYSSYWSDLTTSNWDRIVIVRYRSQRDLVDLFATNEFAQASLHKWASIKEHERMLVQAIHVPSGIFIIMIFAAIIGAIIFATGRYWFRFRPT